ncbi:MAG: flagellar hook-associated protein FlgL [Sedimentisphaerales bacterium]
MSGIMNSIYNNTLFALSRHTEALFALQEQATTGSRINRPSDDPTAAASILNLQSENGTLENYLNSLADTVGTLNISSSVLQQMTSAINQTKTSITQVTSGTYDDNSRQRTAEAIDNTLEQLVQLANTKNNGQYLFGGADTSSAPFAVSRSNGKITSVTYQGSSENLNINVAPGVTSNAFYAGSDLFYSDERSTPVFSGQTGAAAGTGTSSVTGDVWLTVALDGANYKITIDDGATWTPVPSAPDANLQVTDSRTGKVLYVDTTGINSAGTDLVQVPGTNDVFGVLITLRDILNNTKGLSDAQLQQLRSASSGSLDEIQNLLVQKQVSVGSRIGFLSNLQTGLDDIKSNNQTQTDQLQQADIAQVSIDLARHQALYQMSLSVAGKLLSMSLLDFIQ